MTKENGSFGVPKKKQFYNENKGGWFTIYASGANTTFTGVIFEVDNEEKLVLKPYIGADYSEGIKKIKILDGRTRISLASIVGEEEINLETARGFCKYHNRMLEGSNPKNSSQ